MKYLKNINNRFNFFDIVMQSFVIFICLYLIDYFNLLGILLNNYRVIAISITLLITVYVFIEVIKNKLYKLIYIKTINYFDKLLFCCMFTNVFLIYNFITMHSYWKNLLFVSISINLIILLIRLIVISRSLNKATKKEVSVYSVYDLYKGKVKSKKLILLEEKEITTSDKDLLDISLFAKGIEDILLQCSPKETFIISLVGKWGSGKTSITNLVKEKINNSGNAVMETFNPWQYDDKYSLFKGFYNYLFRSLGENFGYVNYKETFQKYQNIIFGVVKKGFDISFDNIFERNSNKDIEEIKKSINDYIMLNSKKIIVVIDDIDRLDKEQILLIFKIVKTVFNFNNIIYVLCFDETRIKKLFDKELHIDPEYLDKIIQNKISVPKIENYILKDIGVKSINNILDNYDINIVDQKRLLDVLTIIFKSFSNLREIIRFINSISVCLKSNQIIKLDVIDLIALEYIKFVDIELYCNIGSNGFYFVSDDNQYVSDYEYLFSETYNKLTKEKYDSLFKGKDIYISLLSNVFPYVKSYKDNNNFRNDYFIPMRDERNASILDKRCFNGRYFGVYFSSRHNFFTQVNQLVSDFIIRINKNNNLIAKEFDKLIASINPKDHNLLFEMIDMRISEINNQEGVFYYLLTNYNKYEDEQRFFELNSSDKAQILLATVIKNNNAKSMKYIEDIAVKDLRLLERVLYWLKPDKYGYNNEFEDLYNKGIAVLRSKLDDVIKSKYKMFDKDNYSKHYCWVFYRSFDDNGKAELKKYLTSQLNKDNIFRAIAVCVVEYVGDNLSYEYNESNAKLIFDIEKINKVLKKVDYELNDDQKVILELYKNKGEKEKNVKLDFNNL